MVQVQAGDTMEIENLLRSMVEVESVFPEEQELAEMLEAILEERGFRVERVPVAQDRFNLVAERGDPDIGFYGHMDTVPVQGNWTFDPLQPRKEDGRMYGLGAFDMKGGIASVLHAALSTEAPVRIMLGVDEELYSRGAYELVGRGYTDDLDYLVIPEIADTGEVSDWPAVILGRRGRAVVRITVQGEPAHGARPSDGESAVLRASELVQELQDLDLREHQALGSESLFIRRIEGAADSLSVPEETVLAVDAHIVPPTTPQSLLERIQESLPGYASAELGDRPNPFLSPFVTAPEAVEDVVEAVEAELRGFETGHGRSVADENVFGQELPVAVIGPRGGNPHDADEWVDLESLHQLSRVFQTIIKK